MRPTSAQAMALRSGERITLTPMSRARNAGRAEPEREPLRFVPHRELSLREVVKGIITAMTDTIFADLAVSDNVYCCA